MSAAARWIALAAAAAGASVGLDAAGVPEAPMFAALLVGLAAAIAGRAPAFPAPGFAVAQAAAGVAIGTYLHASTLTALGWRWVPVVVVSVATLAVTTGSGVALGRLTAIDEVTASLGTIAGGASGIVAMAGDLGGDDRLVAFMQYVRVLVVVLVTPLIAALVFSAHGGGGGPAAAAGILTPAGGWLLVAIVAPLGALLARRTRLPAPALLGPLILSALASIAGLAPAVPLALSEGAFAAIGLAIGLRFTSEQLRAAGRLLPAVLASIGLLIVACFALGALLSAITGLSLLDGYLATTPGGLYAVLPIAVGSGANATFVLAVQALRLFVSVLLAPLVVRSLLARRAAS